MDIPIPWLVVILILLILLSAFFSGSETGLIATNKYRLQALAKKGNKRAKLVIKLLKDTDNLLGTILLGNNFVNILSASIFTIIALTLFGEGYVFLASIVLTVIILIFAETAPKTFAAKNPEKVALFSVYIINILIKLFKPFVWIIRKLAKLVLIILRIKEDANQEKISPEELRMSILDAKDSIENKYKQILLNIIDLQKVTVDDIMINKNEFVGIDINDLGNVIKVIQNSSHTRLIVYEDEVIIGVLHTRKVANLYANDNFSLKSLKSIVVKPYFIPEGIPLATQLEEFQKNKKRLGLVVDEYGEVKGMIALEDILEEIVGEFTSNIVESTISDINKQNDGSYLIDPSINLHKLNQALKLNLKSNSSTLNGLIVEHLQSIPKRDISIKIDNVIIEILQITNNNIKVVKLKIIGKNMDISS